MKEENNCNLCRPSSPVKSVIVPFKLAKIEELFEVKKGKRLPPFTKIDISFPVYRGYVFTSADTSLLSVIAVRSIRKQFGFLHFTSQDI